MASTRVKNKSVNTQLEGVNPRDIFFEVIGSCVMKAVNIEL